MTEQEIKPIEQAETAPVVHIPPKRPRRWEQKYGENKPLPARPVICSRCGITAGRATIYRRADGSYVCRGCLNRGGRHA